MLGLLTRPVPSWVGRLFALALLAALAWGISTRIELARARGRTADAQQAALEQAGWLQGVARRNSAVRDVAPEVEAPPAGISASAGVHVQTVEVPVYLPTECAAGVDTPPSVATGAAPASPGDRERPGSPAPPAFHLSGELQALAAADDAGRFYVKGLFRAHLRAEAWQQTVDLPIDPSMTEFAVSHELERALAAYRHPMRNAVTVGVATGLGLDVGYERLLWRRLGVYGRMEISESPRASAGILWRF